MKIPHAREVSGVPPIEGDCDRCPTPHLGLDLTAAGYDRRLKGSRWLRDRKLGKLRVCRRCGRLWTEHYDSREAYTWYADMGLSAIGLLAEDATPARLVGWAASESTDRGHYWIPLVLEGWIRQRATWPAQVFDIVIDTLSAPIEMPNDLAANRRMNLVVLAVVAAERSTGGRSYPPKPAAAAIAMACAEHPDRLKGALAYRGKSRTLMAHQARLAAIDPPPVEDDALFTADSLVPLIAAALGPPLAAEGSGYGRGQRLRRGYQLLNQLRDDCGRWRATGAKLAMPPAGWRELDMALDPVSLAADAIGHLQDAMDAPPEVRRDLIQECQAFLPVLIEDGARVPVDILNRLRDLLEQLAASPEHADAVARIALHEIVNGLTREARRDCTLTSGACAM